jgi:hypothetical protein
MMRHSEFGAGLHALYAEAGGAYELIIIKPGDRGFLLAAAGAGDYKRLAHIGALDTFCRQIAGRGRTAPLCFTCDRRLSGRGRTALISLFRALRDDATRCLVFGLCATGARRGMVVETPSRAPFCRCSGGCSRICGGYPPPLARRGRHDSGAVDIVSTRLRTNHEPTGAVGGARRPRQRKRSPARAWTAPRNHRSDQMPAQRC